jgi:hypothetical protein
VNESKDVAAGGKALQHAGAFVRGDSPVQSPGGVYEDESKENLPDATAGSSRVCAGRV